MNTEPVQSTFWYDSSQHRLPNLTTHVFHNGSYKESGAQFNIRFGFQQPEMSASKNCAAVLPEYFQHYPWLTIECDRLFKASYVCQSKKKNTSNSTKASLNSFVFNTTCGDGWFMLDGKDKCFSVMGTKGELSYHDAEYQCRSKDASVLAVQVASRSSTSDSSRNIIEEMSRSILLEAGYNMSLDRQNNFLFGVSLSQTYSHNQLPEILFRLTSPHFPTIFVDFHGQCGIVEISLLSLAVSSESEASGLRGWGVKCRDCSEAINVTAIICEKPAEPYNYRCDTNHFQCDDRACILSIYFCDSEPDCFDGSDENNCSLDNGTNRLVDWITLPCDLGDSCSDISINIIPLHAICDGIYSTTTLAQEKHLCYKYKFKHIDLSSLIANSMVSVHTPLNQNTDLIADIHSILKKEILECSEHIHSGNNSRRNLSDLLNDELPSMYTLCKIKPANENYFYLAPEKICQYITCPGMFKCEQYYCIPISHVCDGQYDCKEGDDETVCPFTSCPGLLKCRGENRCVSRDEICDKHVNCLYSMDDEVGCHKCPLHCECVGYAVSCNLNDLVTLSKDDIDDIKAIRFTGSQRNISIPAPRFRGLVTLNFSFCGIEDIMLTKTKSPVKSFILIADFQHNNILKIMFLQEIVFSHIVYLELSFNNLYVIKFSISLSLKHLVMLGIKGNPLSHIMMDVYGISSKLLLIDLSAAREYADLSLNLYLNLYKQITIKVSDSSICCLLYKVSKCTCDCKKQPCFDILENKKSKICFYCFAAISITMAIGQITKQIVNLSSIHRSQNNKKKYFYIVLLNQSAAAALNTLYLAGILGADVLKVNMFFWRRCSQCVLLNFALYISLECIIIFKTSLVIILGLQILYPFNHQCLWLRYTGPISVIIWLLSSSTYFVHLSYQFENESIYVFDTLCSIGMCGLGNTLHLLLYMTCFIDWFAILFCIFPMIKTYAVMVSYKKMSNTLRSNQNLSVNNMSVILKIAIPILTELPFRSCIFILLMDTFVSFLNVEYCKYLFLFALPANTFFSCLCSMYHK